MPAPASRPRAARGRFLAAVLLFGFAFLAVGVLVWRARAPRVPEAAPPAPAPVARPAWAPPVMPSSAPVVPARAGSLALTGVVVDPAGAPVAGATVTVAGPASRRARTDARGRFTVEGLAPAAAVVEATADERTSGPVRVHVRAGLRPLRLVLGPGGRMEIMVRRRDDGGAVAGASVEIRALSMIQGLATVRRGTTGADGRLVLRGLVPGGYAAAAWAPGHAVAEELLQLPAGLEWQVQLRLARGAAVRGRVVDEHGTPVAGAVVAAVSARAARSASLSRPRPWGFSSHTGADGAFVVPALPAGAFVLLASHRCCRLGLSRTVNADGATERDGVEITLSHGGAVAGRVVTPAGAGAPHAVVRANSRTSRGAEVEPREIAGDGDGRFVLQGLPREVLELVATADDASSAAVVVDLQGAAAVHDLVVPLSYAGTISGVVVDGRGAPVAQAVVICTAFLVEAVGIRPVVVESTDEMGRFTCRGLPPGDCHVQATRPFSPNTVQPGLRGAGQRARTGDRGLRLVVPADGALRLRVRLPDGAPARRFTLGLVEGLAPMTVTTADGEHLVPGLPPRTYYVTIKADGFAYTGAVVVRAGETAVADDITLQPFVAPRR